MFYHDEIPVLASEPVRRNLVEASLEIGEPRVIAARDQSPDEGTFVGPRLKRFNGELHLSWSFDWDVVDSNLPEKPNGRVSHDGGLTWEKQAVLKPPGSSVFQTGKRELTAWFRNGFEVPGRPGAYKVPTWRSPDLGQTWGALEWTDFQYPGTKGIDIYAPPEEYFKHDGNYKRGGVKSASPAYLTPFFQAVSRLRGPGGFHSLAADGAGTLYGFVYSRYLRDTAGIVDWDRDYWRRLNWKRYAVLLQISRDNGRTWSFGGVPTDGSDYEGRIDFHPGDGFSEPSLAIYPDGELVCALRTGGNKPLHLIRSRDCGKSWSEPEELPICGVNPALVLLKNGILALGTGRPHCTVHFSNDRGRTWFAHETLFTVIPRVWVGGQVVLEGYEYLYAASHTNVSMVAVADDTLLYVHDACRRDPQAENDWLKKQGHGLIIGRIIRVAPRAALGRAEKKKGVPCKN